MELKSYYDFAVDDYCFLTDLRRSGIMANSIGAIAQNTCERFLKHLINEYIPVTRENRNQVTDVLSTHNLNRLVNYWNAHSENRISDKVASQLKKINGFYFSTKYPGDDCQTLTKENILMCFEVVDICKNAVDEIIKAQNH
ncbi:MAG: hypothetical protein K6F82_06900 [Sphaerochaetaceae bacterium]|nr:hypothetical protein [Sphaerochaetaceae bacterium]